jgi:hypothetical protein
MLILVVEAHPGITNFDNGHHTMPHGGITFHPFFHQPHLQVEANLGTYLFISNQAISKFCILRFMVQAWPLIHSYSPINMQDKKDWFARKNKNYE